MSVCEHMLMFKFQIFKMDLSETDIHLNKR